MEPEPSKEPEILRKRTSPAGDPSFTADVGEFRQGSAMSQWALGRYLVGRALTESIGAALLVIAAVLLVLAVAAQWGLHSTVATVLLVIMAIGVLLLRWILLAVVRRLTGFARFGTVEDRMRALVADTRGDVLRELRRVGLPGRVLTLPLLAVRLLSRTRRPDTMARLRTFRTEHAVPKARLDEVHLLLRQAATGATTGATSRATFGGVPPESR